MHHLDADLFYLTLRRAVPPDSVPVQLDPPDSFWLLPPDEIVSEYLGVSAFICNALEAVVAREARLGLPTIIEGSWILPSFAAQTTYEALDLASAVRSLFIVEPDLEELEERRRRRIQPWSHQDPTYIHNLAIMRHLCGQEIAREAEALNLPSSSLAPSTPSSTALSPPSTSAHPEALEG
jgi:2-phosphoglycerate kinase